MGKNRFGPNDSVHWFMNEITSDIIAKSGQPKDRFYLGKIIHESLRRYPESIHQIDGVTGRSESNASVFERTVRCAIIMKNLGLQQGDVITLMAPNHLDICIPFYAALYIGVTVSTIDQNLLLSELQGTFNITKPKIIFCQSEKAPNIQVALNEIDLDAKIVTFDKGDYLCSFQEFMEKYNYEQIEEFEVIDLAPEDAVAFLISTSGTTGLPKAAAVTHKNLTITLPYFWAQYRKFPTPTKLAMVGSPLQWLTALMNFAISPILNYTRLQLSVPLDLKLCIDIIDKYRPTWILFGPPMITSIIKQQQEHPCDFTCFETIFLGGSAVASDLIDEIKAISPNTEVYNGYGMSELTGIGFTAETSPPGSCGKPLGCWEYRLMNVDTGDDIYDADTPGELWMRGPGLFKEYHNNPEATAETFAEGGWFRTGDLFYKDKNNYYYYVDRIKLLLKYKVNQISPIELENLIHQQTGVLDVAVTGIADAENGELPVACVVPKPGFELDAEEIKQFVKDNLSDYKQLRGGVIFFDQLPLTPSGKINRKKLKESVKDMDRLLKINNYNL